jgi:hypothetical protein
VFSSGTRVCYCLPHQAKHSSSHRGRIHSGVWGRRQSTQEVEHLVGFSTADNPGGSSCAELHDSHGMEVLSFICTRDTARSGH